jgi:hypothetical protein
MLNNEQYFELCASCDSLLNRRKTLNRVAIPWLHILRWHPFLLKDYISCFTEKSFKYHLALNLKKLFTYLMVWLRSFYRSFFFKKKKFNYLGRSKGKYDIVLVTHFLGPKSVSSDCDHYFGSLHKDLKLQGIEVLRVFINHTDDLKLDMLMRGREITDTVILPKSANLLVELNIFWGFLKEFLILFYQAALFSSGKGVMRFIALRASVEALSGRSREALIIAKNILQVVNQHQVTNILFTYEGHSWEKILVNLARRNDYKLKLIGYQFVGLTEGNHAVNNSFGFEYEPDLLMCTGELAAEKFKKRTSNNGVKFDVLGTFRLPSISNAMEYFGKKRYLEKSVCLVLPEGLDDEVIRLVEYAKSLARNIPTIDFVIRLHPLTNKDLILREDCFIDLPPNIQFSSTDLVTDALAAKWAIYQGSTSVLQCFALGVIPLYIHSGDMIIDALMQDKNSPYFLRSQNDFYEIIRNWHIKGVQVDWVNNVSNQLTAMYQPFDSSKILQRLENIQCRI